MFYGLATNEAYWKQRINLFIALAPAVNLTNSNICKNKYPLLIKMDKLLEN